MIAKPAIRAEAERFSEREGVPIRVEADESLPEVSDDCALTLYRITQESLHNIAKHAQATSARLELFREDDELCLRIEDDGCGFDVPAARSKAGLGLVSMSERVQLLQGRLTVDSTPGKGSMIEVRAPLARRFDAETASVVG